jgi:hypothetical protein
MKAVFSACCETVIQDIRTNSLSLINLMDEIHAVAFPVLMPKICFVASIERSEEEASPAPGRLIGKLNGNEVFSFETTFDFQGKTRSRAVGEFQGLLVQGPGTLDLSLHHEEQILATVKIEVKHVGNPQAQLFGGPNALQPL